jgi:hypothetical protein
LEALLVASLPSRFAATVSAGQRLDDFGQEDLMGVRRRGGSTIFVFAGNSCFRARIVSPGRTDFGSRCFAVISLIVRERHAGSATRWDIPCAGIFPASADQTEVPNTPTCQAKGLPLRVSLHGGQGTGGPADKWGLVTVRKVVIKAGVGTSLTIKAER